MKLVQRMAVLTILAFIVACDGMCGCPAGSTGTTGGTSTPGNGTTGGTTTPISTVTPTTPTNPTTPTTPTGGTKPVQPGGIGNTVGPNN